MKVVCIHQPDFLPYLGFWERLLQSNTFIILDHVQFIRQGWQNRNRIKTPDGWIWLTVPVIKKGRYFQSLIETEIDTNEPWMHKHLRTIETCYGKGTHFARYYELLKEAYSKNWVSLVDFNLELFYLVLKELDINPEIFRSSQLKSRGKSSELLASLTEEVGGDVYLSGPGGKDYLEEEFFTRKGIEVTFHDFVSTEYPQLFGNFIPNLSVIDALINCGQDTRKLIEKR